MTFFKKEIFFNFFFSIFFIQISKVLKKIFYKINMFIVVSTILVCCIFLCILILCLVFPRRYNCDCFQNIETLRFDRTPIYIIHQSTKTERQRRFINFISLYFPKNNFYIIEPLTQKQVLMEIENDVHHRKITKKAKMSTLSKLPADHGSFTFSALSLALTYLKIFKMEKRRQNSHFIILEDDFLIRPSFHKDFSNSLQSLEKKVGNQWDMLYMSCHFNSYLKRMNIDAKSYHNFLKVKSRLLHGLGAVLYKRNSVDIILNEIYPLKRQIDHDIPEKFILTNKLNAYILLNKKKRPLIYNDNYFYKSTTQS
jgi:hypothetical protein